MTLDVVRRHHFDALGDVLACFVGTGVDRHLKVLADVLDEKTASANRVDFLVQSSHDFIDPFIIFIFERLFEIGLLVFEPLPEFSNICDHTHTCSPVSFFDYLMIFPIRQLIR